MKNLDLPVNRVAQSGIITLDPAQFIPNDLDSFDLKPFLFRELVLMEKPFREAIQQYDWSKHASKAVAVFCSADAIIPNWAWMLVASRLEPFTKGVFFGPHTEAINKLTLQNIRQMDVEAFRDKKVVIKGCGEKPFPEEGWLLLTLQLQPVVQSLMYGEPCSTVPVFKKSTSNPA